MKIAHISSSGELRGGAEFCLLDLVKYEKKIGIEPIVLLPTRGELAKALEAQEVPYEVVHYLSWRHPTRESALTSQVNYLIKVLYNFLQEIRICKSVRSRNIDLIHINTTATYAGALTARLLKIPLIWHFREFNSPDKPHDFYSKKFSSRTIKQAHMYIAVSDCMKAFYRELLNISNIEVIYDSMNKPESQRSTCIFNRDTVNIVVIANKTESKGQIDALKALFLLKKRNISNIHLSLVGKEESSGYCTKLKAFVETNNLMDSVSFKDFSKNPFEVLSKADIALNCSRSESFGRTTVEAMMMGCVVIGNDNTCTHDLLSHGRGLLYKSPSDLSCKIQWAIENPEQSEAIAKHAQEYALSSFSDGNEKIVSLFKAVIAEASVGQAID